MNEKKENQSPGSSEPQTLRDYLANAVVPYLMPYADGLSEIQGQFAQFAKTVNATMEELNRRLRPFLDEVLPVIRKIVETDWTAVLRNHEQSIIHMADCGWTMPDWIGLSELNTLHLKSPEELDNYFTDGFMANDAENLKELGKRLKDAEGLSKWHPLIDEIIDSIIAARHRVAIPATLTIVEGYISNALVKASLATPSNTTPFKKLVKAGWHEQDTYEAIFWRAGVMFLSRVFADSDFTQQPPTFINRHWILHGRAPVDWTLTDALRLVTSLTTLLFLFDSVGQPKPNSPKWHGDPNDGFSITRKVQEPTH